MKLWIVRHGKAESKSDSGRDEDRALSKRGERQANWLGQTIAARGDTPKALLTSPIRRAIETARLINSALNLKLEIAPALESGRPASQAVDLIGGLEGSGPWMLVGHNPQLEKLVGVLVQGPGAGAEMKTGQAVLIELDRESPVGTGKVQANLRLDEE